MEIVSLFENLGKIIVCDHATPRASHSITLSMNDEACTLYDNDRLVTRWAMGPRGCRIGADPSCDVRIETAPRHVTWLVRREHGSVFLYTVRRDHDARHARAERRHLPLGTRVPLHGTLRIVREDACRKRLNPSESLPVLPNLPDESGQPDRAGNVRARCTPSTTGVSHVALDSHRAGSLQIGSGVDARRYQLSQDTLTIGSDSSAHITLHDPLVDRHHCMVEPVRGGEVWLRDLGSRHGTFVNEVRVGVAQLRPGARIRIGRSTLSFVGAEQASTAPKRDAGTPVWITASTAMQRIREQVARYAPLSWPVLITGETGVGKELVAQQLHQLSGRDGRPLVSVNAGAFSPTLLDSELFGHEKGAFTGAQHAHAGVFEQADDSTLFLDEIGELPLDQQTRLLRVLETGEVRRVGAEKVRQVQVRLVCATHRDLRQHAGYRSDLLYRLSRLWIHIPPLRERPEDIAALTHHFLRELSTDTLCRAMDAAAMTRLLAHPWRGNTRELRNVLSTAAVHCSDDVLRADDIDRALLHTLRPLCEQDRGQDGGEREGVTHPATHMHLAFTPPAPARIVAHDGRSSHEPQVFRSVLQLHDGNVSAAARSLGIPRSTLRDRIRRCATAPYSPAAWPISPAHADGGESRP